MKTYIAKIYRGEERVDTREVQAKDHKEAKAIVEKSLGKHKGVTYDIEIILK